jgi:hypothetical protein
VAEGAGFAVGFGGFWLGHCFLVVGPCLFLVLYRWLGWFTEFWLAVVLLGGGCRSRNA